MAATDNAPVEEQECRNIWLREATLHALSSWAESEPMIRDNPRGPYLPLSCQVWLEMGAEDSPSVSRRFQHRGNKADDLFFVVVDGS
jgi:hypothetical protein